MLLDPRLLIPPPTAPVLVIMMWTLTLHGSRVTPTQLSFFYTARFIFNLIFFVFPGCLLEGPATPHTHHAPDVPPRNPTMSRMNGRIPNDLDMDFEPSCLVRTPSGNVYIPSGNLSKSNSFAELQWTFWFWLKSGEDAWKQHNLNWIFLTRKLGKPERKSSLNCSKFARFFFL